MGAQFPGDRCEKGGQVFPAHDVSMVDATGGKKGRRSVYVCANCGGRWTPAQWNARFKGKR